ncbi:hypothetical protein H4R99_005731 [Coemansia sp. RSA 1722]|nr:hypothetical protein LPJ57_005648 [Coemansia sp. RSA 486]KAJ2594528.1 hypothetical protein H4R99_005731 [Coemansia sp. RSA 1722]KAJ2635477.1 hypothetical protein GGF40_003587 [Coemansia sp. RSA 1286]
MVKIFASAVAAFALVQSACAHMAVISPPPRNGVIGDELLKPCGGGNEVTRNVTTFSVDSTSNFVLRPSHGTGNLIFNYFTDLTVTNNSVAHPLANIEIPKADTYDTPIDFGKAGLKNGQQIVVQAIYNGTDDGETVPYYVCFDVKLGEVEDASSDANSDGEQGSVSDDGDELDSVESSESKSSSASSAFVSTKSVLGAAAGLLIAAFAF